MTITGEHTTTFGGDDQLKVFCEWEIELSVTSDPYGTGDNLYRHYAIEDVKVSNIVVNEIEVKNPSAWLIHNLQKEIEIEVLDNFEVYI